MIFCHGYKGFKDWGAWNYVGESFAGANLNFIKFNFSFNGTTLEQPLDFSDLEAFGKNNYVTELDDLGQVIDWIESDEGLDKYFDKTNIYLIGHSRGGGIVLLKSYEDKRIKKVITWASVSDYFTRIPNEEGLKKWKQEGVIYEKNGRTNQNMPIYYQFYESLMNNRKRLDISNTIKYLEIPLLIIHGAKDHVVKIEEATNLNRWSKTSVLEIIPNGDHTFGTKHPITESYEIIDELIEKSIHFLM